MGRVVAYTRSGPETIDVVKFATDRGYQPDQLAVGSIVSVMSTVTSGDTLLLYTVESFDIGKAFGYAILALELIERGVTVVSIKENFVLKDDLQSRITVGLNAMSHMIQKTGD